MADPTPHQTLEEFESLAEAVTRIRAEWNRGDDGDWHYLHGPAGDNLKPEKASPAIAQLLTAIRADLDDLAVLAAGYRKAEPDACPDFWPSGEHLDPPTESCECGHDLNSLDQIARLIFEPDDSCAHNLAPLMDWLTARDADLRAEGALRKRIEALCNEAEASEGIVLYPGHNTFYTVETGLLRAALTEAGGES